MVDLSTTYLDLRLKNPLVVSASPLSKRIERARRLEEAGAAAIVMYSLFEEQIQHESLELDHYLNRSANAHAEALSYFPDLDSYNVGPEPYLEHLFKLKQSVSIPVIGSLNGVSTGGWVDYAAKIEQAGADALELNLYHVPTDLDKSGEELEEASIQLVRDIRSRISIPIAVKLSPFYTSLPNMARNFVQAGAHGLVLFNRFYQPDFNLETLEVVPDLVLSTSQDLRLPLRWVAILYHRVQADFAITSGVHSAQDVLKAMMAGARVAMMASALLSRGASWLEHVLREITLWMESHNYTSIAQMQGSMSQRAIADPAAFERANYMKALNTFDNRINL